MHSASRITIESGFIRASTRFDMEPRFSLFGQDFHLSGAAPTGELSRPSVLNGTIGQPFTLATTVSFSSFPCCFIPEGDSILYQFIYQSVTYEHPLRQGPSAATYRG